MIHVVIAYDIVCNKRRNRLAKLLLGFGERVNYSVFECRLRERQLGKLQGEVLKMIDPDEDRVRYYFLCRDCRKRIQIVGQPGAFVDEDLHFL